MEPSGDPRIRLPMFISLATFTLLPFITSILNHFINPTIQLFRSVSTLFLHPLSTALPLFSLHFVTFAERSFSPFAVNPIITLTQQPFLTNSLQPSVNLSLYFFVTFALNPYVNISQYLFISLNLKPLVTLISSPLPLRHSCSTHLVSSVLCVFVTFTQRLFVTLSQMLRIWDRFKHWIDKLWNMLRVLWNVLLINLR